MLNQIKSDADDLKSNVFVLFCSTGSLSARGNSVHFSAAPTSHGKRASAVPNVQVIHTYQYTTQTFILVCSALPSSVGKNSNIYIYRAFLTDDFTKEEEMKMEEKKKKWRHWPSIYRPCLFFEERAVGELFEKQQGYERRLKTRRTTEENQMLPPKKNKVLKDTEKENRREKSRTQNRLFHDFFCFSFFLSFFIFVPLFGKTLMRAKPLCRCESCCCGWHAGHVWDYWRVAGSRKTHTCAHTRLRSDARSVTSHPALDQSEIRRESRTFGPDSAHSRGTWFCYLSVWFSDLIV